MFVVFALLVLVGSTAAQKKMDCRCTTAPNTRVRDAPCGNEVKTVERNKCFRYYGREYCNGKRRFDHLAEVDYDGQLEDVGYIDAAFLWNCDCHFRTCRSVGNGYTPAKESAKTRQETAGPLPDCFRLFYCYLPDDVSKLNAFKLVDASHDLYVSTGEFRDFVLHDGLTDEQLDMMFQQADTNHDGKLSYLEFNDGRSTWCGEL